MSATSTVSFEFMGTVRTDLELDPKEFAGMGRLAITEEIEKLLSEIRPDASFFPDDIELAAEVLTRAVDEAG